MDKMLKNADSVNAKVCKQQGGATRGAGPNSAKSPKTSGDQVTNSSRFTSQDNSLEQGGGTKNPFLEV